MVVHYYRDNVYSLVHYFISYFNLVYRSHVTLTLTLDLNRYKACKSLIKDSHLACYLYTWCYWLPVKRPNTTVCGCNVTNDHYKTNRIFSDFVWYLSLDLTLFPLNPSLGDKQFITTVSVEVQSPK